MWRLRRSAAPATQAPEPRLASVLSLSRDELSNVLFFLDLRAVASLYACGSPQLWSKIRESSREAHQTAEWTDWFGYPIDNRVITRNPFLILSQLPLLTIVKLHRIAWMPGDGDPCPFRLLPPTLDKLEFESMPSSSFSTPQERRCLLNFDFESAFPRLRALRLSVCSVWQAPLLPTDEPSLSVPPSLTVLSSYYAYSKDVIMDALLSKPKHVRHLAVLEVDHVSVTDLPPLAALPPSLVHIAWLFSAGPAEPLTKSKYYNYDVLDDKRNVSIAPGSEASRPVSRLESVNFGFASPSVHNWIASCPSRLISVHCTAPSMQTPLAPLLPPCTASLEHLTLDGHYSDNALSMVQLERRGVHLKSLRAESIPNIEGTTTAVLSSLTALDLGHLLDYVYWCLPRYTLTSLRLQTIEEEWESGIIRALPETLTEFYCSEHCTPIDVGYASVFPRALKHLSFKPHNEFNMALSQLQLQNNGSLPDDGLPYHLIKPDAAILLGLPPNLKTLTLWGEMQMDSLFGRFLPRSLELLRSTPMVEMSGLTSSTVRAIGSFIGLTSSISQEEELYQNLLTFPPNCVCDISFHFSLRRCPNIHELLVKRAKKEQ